MINLEKFRASCGKPFDSRKVPDEIILKYSGLLPESIISLWKEDGWCGYADGLFWTVNPDEYTSIANEWLHCPDPVIPFARTAFGDLIVWFIISNQIFIDLINVRYQTFDVLGENVDYVFENILNDYDLESEQFTDAFQKLGSLKADECYGYVPILALGGTESVDNLKIVKLKEHIDILTHSANLPL